jgi:hypothetical protein
MNTLLTVAGIISAIAYPNDFYTECGLGQEQKCRAVAASACPEGIEVVSEASKTEYRYWLRFQCKNQEAK